MSKIFKRYDVIIIIFLFFLTIIAEHNEFFSLLEDQTLTVRHALRASFGDQKKMSFPGDKIAIITTDESFFEEYNGFPLRRSDLGKIIENIKKLGGKVIGVDMLLDYKSSYGEDPAFAESLKNAGNVVLASRAVFQDSRFTKIIYPTELFQKVSDTGYVNISSASSSTSINRLEVHPEITRHPDGWPIAIQMLAKYFNTKPVFEDNKIILGDIIIHLDHLNNIYIDFPVIPAGYSNITQFAGLSAIEFLNISDLDEEEIEELRYWVDGKLVLFGDTSEVSHDEFDTPTGKVYGVEIIADTISTILKGVPLKVASTSTEILITFFFLLFLVICSSILHNPTSRIFLTFFIFIFYICLSIVLYVYKGLIISMSYNLMAGVLAYLAISLQSYIQERKLKLETQAREELVRTTFGRYLSDEIVYNILDTPGGMQLGGEKKKLTIMMTDLRGFTAIGERLPAEDVVSIINNYLEVMTPIIVKYQGTIDEFIGDAILVIFGAPISREDDTQRAVACAVEMQLAMDVVNRKNRENGFPEVAQGIGLNTGEVVVGNIGSEIRSKYGVVGRNVNLTARIESYTVGGQIYIPETTKDDVEKALGKVLIIGSHMKVSPKGVKEPITIYEIRGISGDYKLKMPVKPPLFLTDLIQKIHISIIMLSGKDASSNEFEGAITRLEEKTAEITSSLEVEHLANLKLTLFDNTKNIITKDIYCKVIEVLNEGFLVEFTSIPPAAETYFKDSLINSGKITELYTEDQILKILKSEMQESMKYGINLSILMIQMNSFDKIKNNDIQQVMFSTVSKTCKHLIRGLDSIGVYQNDRILIILPNFNEQQAHKTAMNLKTSIEDFDWNKYAFNPSISFGISQINKNDNVEELLSRAEDVK